MHVCMLHTHTHTQNGILVNVEKEENLAIFNNMDGVEDIMLSKMSKIQKEILYDLTCM